jgi:hypothetical protein
MRYLYLVFLLPSLALADADRTVSKQRLFQISCERGLMSMFMEYGNGAVSNREFLKNAVNICGSMAKNVTRKEWTVMTSPTEAGCSNAVKAMSEGNKGIPEAGQLFATYCMN